MPAGETTPRPVTTTRRAAAGARTGQAWSRASEALTSSSTVAVRRDALHGVLRQRQAEGVLDRHAPLDRRQAVEPEVVDQRRVAHQLRRRDGQLLGGERQQLLRQVGGVVTGRTLPSLRRPSAGTATVAAMVLPSVLAGELVGRAQRLADELLRPSAEQVDRTAVPRSHLDAWAAEGLLGLAGPRAYGGAQAAPAVQREVAAVMAGACGSTWFVATQHTLPVTALAASPNEALRERRLAALCTGEVLAGVAFSHLRRPGPPAVLATRVDGGWRFDGAVSWMTGWGLCDVLLLAGRTDGDEVVFVLRRGARAAGADGVRAAGARRDGRHAHGRARPSTACTSPTPTSSRSAARPTGSPPTPCAPRTPRRNLFGLQRECVQRLAETASARDDGTAAALAHALGQEGTRLRRVAETLLDDVAARRAARGPAGRPRERARARPALGDGAGRRDRRRRHVARRRAPAPGPRGGVLPRAGADAAGAPGRPAAVARLRCLTCWWWSSRWTRRRCGRPSPRSTARARCVRSAVVERGPDLVADAAAALTALAAGDLAARLLALAVAVGPATADVEAAGLVTALTGGGTELLAGWALPAELPVLAGASADWEAQGATAAERPLVAGAAVAAARSVGAHAHLPPG